MKKTPDLVEAVTLRPATSKAESEHNTKVLNRLLKLVAANGDATLVIPVWRWSDV